MSTTNYVLSTIIPTQQRNPRSAAIIDDNHIIIGGADGTVQEFTRNNNTMNFAPSTEAIQIHESSVYSLLPVPKDHPHYPAFSYVSGGGDKTITVTLSDGSVLHRMIGHTGPVESLAFARDSQQTLLSGGWDGTVHAWRNSTSVMTDARNQYSTQICVLPNGNVVTGSGNKTLALYSFLDNSSNCSLELIVEVPNAHNHVIRKILYTEKGIVTCSNDGYIKLWSFSLELLETIEAYVPTSIQAEFIYDLVELENGVIVACGDDKTVRFFDFNKNVTKNIPGEHHAPQEIAYLEFPQIIRTMYKFQNEDLLFVSGGGVFIFTFHNTDRVAPEDVKSAFTAMLDTLKDADMDKVDVTGLPTVVALLTPGNKNGAHQVVNIDGKAMVCVWNEDGYEWELIGEAMGKKKASSKTLYNGVEYDHVVDVDVDPNMPPLQLPFNKDDDPYEVASKFIARNGISVDGLMQVVQFITPYIDQAALERKKKNKQAETQHKLSNFCEENWSYIIAHVCKLQLMKTAIVKRNTELQSDAQSTSTTLLDKTVNVRDIILDDNDLIQLDHLLYCAEHAKLVEYPDMTQNDVALLMKLLSWPLNKITPVIDLLRVLMCNESYSSILINLNKIDQTFATVTGSLFNILKIVSKNNANSVYTPELSGLIILALQAISNYIAKRALTEEEKARRVDVMPPQPLLIFTNSLIEQVIMIDLDKNPRFVDEVGKFVLNVCCWMNKQPSLKNNDMYLKMIGYVLTVLVTPDQVQKQAFDSNSRLMHIITEVYQLLCYSSHMHAKVKQLVEFNPTLLNAIKLFTGSAPSFQSPAIATMGNDLKMIYKL